MTLVQPRAAAAGTRARAGDRADAGTGWSIGCGGSILAAGEGEAGPRPPGAAPGPRQSIGWRTGCGARTTGAAGPSRGAGSASRGRCARLEMELRHGKSMGTPQRRSLTEREYLDREAQAAERHEYVDGVAYPMAGGSERHSRIAGNLMATLRTATRGTPCGVYVSSMKLRVAHAAAYYYPDVMMSGEPGSPETIFKAAPCLVAEVLSPSTAATDTREKLHAYRGIETLRYYVVVDSDRVCVSYHVRGDDGGWLAASLDPGERLEVLCGPVRAALTLASIYEDTGLAAA